MTTDIGVVESFGDDGWGALVDSHGRTWPFHSTAIVDGSRSIELQAKVTFHVVPGRQGRWEATDVAPHR